MNRAVALSLAILFYALTGASVTLAQSAGCDATDFSGVVDETAQALRELNASGAQRFQAKLKSYQQQHDLSDAEIKARTATIQDGKMNEFNREIETLVSQMDALSQTPSENINCEKLEELKRVRDRLLTVMGQKSGYLLARADQELDQPAGTSPAPQAAAPQNQAEAPAETPADRPGKEDKLAAAPSSDGSADPPATEKPALAPRDAPAPQESANAAPPVAEAGTETLNPDLPQRKPKIVSSAQDWRTDSQVLFPPPGNDGEQKIAAAPAEPTGEPPTPLAPSSEADEQRFATRTERNEAPPTSLAPPDPDQTYAPPLTDGAFPRSDQPLDTTYSIEEISDAGRGIFGTVTAQFAAAINYAFQQFGRPNAYITGSEGGAAFLAGLRYGKGKLHSKAAPVRAIYWQGPSLGYDVGAEGSNAFFLVYNLEQEDNIYGRFTGIGGAAYVAGGVGLNVLGKGDMVMVPIRTGVGLRIGANLAYLKFTERQTWNPF